MTKKQREAMGKNIAFEKADKHVREGLMEARKKQWTNYKKFNLFFN